MAPGLKIGRVAGLEELTSILGTVHDQASALDATPRAVAVMARLLATARQDKKARTSDLEAVRRKYEIRIAAAKEAFDCEAQRVRSVPGGMMALMAFQGHATGRPGGPSLESAQ